MNEKEGEAKKNIAINQLKLFRQVRQCKDAKGSL